ncbi:PTS sugar transporter subunit IIA [Anaerorhabdus sp.]|uniref:PTS sugar transporter subunit IIA n=1 Tax=Anaerorhabdus sp. TaxID=1872524 RepID=UPI002B1EC567|nr:PTS sugar transporter subunit IIA [Anaerorhabdus sp.]MEA4876203.1 PTS sugar transporter subunit IIA [Anaerorhabdus sp.]
MLIQKILDNKVTSYKEGFDTWQEAIRGGAEALIEQGFIEPVYVDAVIACVEKYGPYIVIAPDIAMPHSTEGAEGVLKTGIGFMKVEKAVCFDPNDPEKDARLFFTLAAENHEEHLNNMMELSEMLMNEDLVKDLLEVKNDEDLKKVGEKYTI